MTMRLLLPLVLLLSILFPAEVLAADSISLNTAAPHLGGVVTFGVSAPTKYDCVGHAKCARVEVECFQAGSLVYGEAGDLGQARGDGTSPLGYNGFLLGGGGSIWLTVGGPADCQADLFRFTHTGPTEGFELLATTTFAAGG